MFIGRIFLKVFLIKKNQSSDKESVIKAIVDSRFFKKIENTLFENSIDEFS